MAYQTIEQYIEEQEPQFRDTLQKIRQTIRESAPDAIECIKWAMPTFWQKENLVHFFLHKKYIGFYPDESGIAAFNAELDELGYKYSKGAVQFPLNKEMPYDLISKITKFRLKEVEELK